MNVTRHTHAPSLLYKHSFSLFRYNLPDRDEIEFCKSDSRMMMLPSVFSLIFRRGQQTLFPLFPLPDFMEIIWPQQQIQNMNWKFGVYLLWKRNISSIEFRLSEGILRLPPSVSLFCKIMRIQYSFSIYIRKNIEQP